MKNNVYKLTDIDNEIINLYIECFKKDIIFTTRDKDIIKDRKIIKRLFNYFIKYGTILYTKRYSKKISFLCALKMNEIFEDKEAVKLIFNKEKYPEINKYINKIDKNSNYIILVGVNKKFRKRGLAKKLVKTYLHYYNKKDLVFTDVDNKYSLKVFKSLNFNVKEVNNNYFIAEKYKIKKDVYNGKSYWINS